MLAFLEFSDRHKALRDEYARLLTELADLLAKYSIPKWPTLLADWQGEIIDTSSWRRMHKSAERAKKCLGGMGALGDIVIVHEGRAVKEANTRLLRLVESLDSVTAQIINNRQS